MSLGMQRLHLVQVQLQCELQVEFLGGQEAKPKTEARGREPLNAHMETRQEPTTPDFPMHIL